MGYPSLTLPLPTRSSFPPAARRCNQEIIQSADARTHAMELSKGGGGGGRLEEVGAEEKEKLHCPFQTERKTDLLPFVSEHWTTERQVNLIGPMGVSFNFTFKNEAHITESTFPRYGAIQW